MNTTRRLLAAVILVVALGGIVQIIATAQRNDSVDNIMGVWRESARTFTKPDTKTETRRQPSVVIFTRSYYSIDMVL